MLHATNQPPPPHSDKKLFKEGELCALMELAVPCSITLAPIRPSPDDVPLSLKFMWYLGRSEFPSLDLRNAPDPHDC